MSTRLHSMQSVSSSFGGVKSGGDAITRSTGFEWLARAGFVSRGVIYAIIGVLALKLALGAGGKTTNQQGALATIAHQPFGKVLLIAVAVGLGAYSFWRLIRALLGHGPAGSDSGIDRVDALASGIVYAGLCATAVEIISTSSAGTSGGAKGTTAGVLGWPAGTWVVGIVGVVLIGVGLYQGYRGLSKRFLKDSKTEEMTPAVERRIIRAGMFGHLARMVVFALVGVFLVKAVVDFNPKKAVGLDGALATLVHQSYGPVLLGVVAAGLVASAVYSISDARYRRI